MVNRNTFPVSLFAVAFLSALLLAAPQTYAAMQTFEKEYTYTASELDSKSSCRAIALEQVKRILLQELGVYVESVFNDKASTDGRTKDEVRREITTLSAGVASTEVVEEKWDGTTYWLKARIKADPDDVAKKIEALRQDKQKVAELEESRKRAAELSQELQQMRNELDATKSAAAKAERAKQYNDTVQQLSAMDWVVRGYAFKSAGMHDEEIEAYSKAIEVDPKYVDAYNSRGFAYEFVFDNPRQALKDYDEVVKLAPEWGNGYLSRGRVYEKLGDFQRAIKDYDKAIELNPKVWAYYHNRGDAYLNLDDYQRAIKDYDKAIAMNMKPYAGTYYARGCAYFELGDYQRAIRDYDKAIVMEHKGADCYYFRGLSYEKLGNHQRAVADWKAAARLGDAGAQELLKKDGIGW